MSHQWENETGQVSAEQLESDEVGWGGRGEKGWACSGPGELGWELRLWQELACSRRRMEKLGRARERPEPKLEKKGERVGLQAMRGCPLKIWSQG